MSESLDSQLEAHFAGVSDEALIRRMERAPDFGYDDEAYELDRRLKALGRQAWRWAQIDGRDRVVLYELENDEPHIVRGDD